MGIELSKKISKQAHATASWSRLHHKLLKSSVASLTPPIEDAGFDHLFARLDEELSSKDLKHLKIETYFGDEWFCPDQSTAIAVPFWLADKRLKSIERKMIGYVEGETDDEFMRLLRHEAGHCVEHAYRLSKRQDWRAIFGNPNRPYDPDNVMTTPEHPNYVENLSGGYAQTHPEEDFAETFAVWLDPGRNCWDDYRARPHVLQKLLYVDEVLAECASKKPKRRKFSKISQARRMRRTLMSYYQQRMRQH
jgi:hypothetical protein